jgi:hypothetical protein
VTKTFTSLDKDATIERNYGGHKEEQGEFSFLCSRAQQLLEIKVTTRPLLIHAGAFVAMMFIGGAVFANCGAIQNSDERNMCRALSERNSSACGAIQNADKRNMCRAQAERNPSACGAIQNSDLRNQCRALSK